MQALLCGKEAAGGAVLCRAAACWYWRTVMTRTARIAYLAAVAGYWLALAAMGVAAAIGTK